MGIFARAAGARASITGDLWRRLLNHGEALTKSGVRVGDSVAMAHAAAWACMRLMAEDVAKLPLDMFQRTKEGKERATSHPYHYLVHDAPNSWQTSFEWREQMQLHQELRGNNYSYINRVRGEVRELIPYDHPDKVTPKRLANWQVEYHCQGDGVRSAGEILHVHGLSLDGLVGLSTLRAAREAVGLGVAAERHGARLFGNGARPGLVVEHPTEFKDTAVTRLENSIREATTGDNAYGLLMLEEGVKLSKGSEISMSNDDAQFLQTRKFQVSEIARFWRIPPHKIGDLEHATFSNIEHQALEYVMDSVVPRIKRIEQRLNRSLLNERERREFFFEFNTDALLRGDLLNRMSAHQIAFLNGFRSRNEIRAIENMNAVEGGDEFRVPANTLPAVGVPPAPLTGA